MRVRMIGTVAAVAMAALALTACGSDSDDAASTSDTSASASASVAAEDIVAVASSNPDFSTLTAAVTAAGLGETLQGEGPYTVFAPTNAAFEKLPAGLVDKLLLPENKDALTKILTYHVVAGKVESGDITPGDVKTVEGQTVTLSTDGGVKVNDATVTTADVQASNGVIHVIDTVLVPSDVDVSSL